MPSSPANGRACCRRKGRVDNHGPLVTREDLRGPRSLFFAPNSSPAGGPRCEGTRGAGPQRSEDARRDQGACGPRPFGLLAATGWYMSVSRSVNPSNHGQDPRL
jgi:hypothetical protein